MSSFLTADTPQVVILAGKQAFPLSTIFKLVSNIFGRLQGHSYVLVCVCGGGLGFGSVSNLVSV